MTQEILMPSLGSDAAEARLARWLKREGDRIEIGDIVAEAETDKATMEIEADRAGVLRQILVPAQTGGLVAGQPIGLLQDGREAEPEGRPGTAASLPEIASASGEGERQIAPATPAAVEAGTPIPTGGHRQGAGDRIFASPLARRIAAERRIDLRSLRGTGPRSRILAADVRAASGREAAEPRPAHAEPSAPAPRIEMPHRLVPLNAMRRISARRLQEAKATVPHFYLSREIEVDGLLALRAQLNADILDSDASAPRISLNDMLIKAVAGILRRNPDLNVSYAGDHLVLYDDVDISVAVSTPNGLITPIIRRADEKSLLAISAEMRDLVERARAGRLSPNQYQGGSFSVTNLGMYGVEEFAAILNPPQAAILAIGAAVRRPSFGDADTIVARSFIRCTLSLDHRAVDGAAGAAWLADLQSAVSRPLPALL